MNLISYIKDAISKLGKRDVKWLKLLFEKNLFTKEAIQVCYTLNQYLEIDSDTDNKDDFTNDTDQMNRTFLMQSFLRLSFFLFSLYNQ